MKWYFYSVYLVFLLYKGVQGFFIKHQSSGSCLIARTEVKDGEPGNAWGLLYFMDLQDKCLDKRALFRFLDTGAIRNDDAKGCISASIKTYVGHRRVLFMYQPTDRNKDAICGSGSALIQTKEGGLLDRDFYNSHYFKVKSNLCAKPLPQSLTTKYGANLTELVYTCDQEDQIFSFGSVTCEGHNMVDVTCPPNQVMIIKNAFYGGSSKIKACGYAETSSCTLDATCALKHICDGLESCSTTVNSSLVDHDPCPGKKKYLYFEYQCLNKSDSVKEVQLDDSNCTKQILKDNSKITDSSFTSSSHEAGHEAYKARFTGNTSWCTGCEQDPFLQIDLGKQYAIKQVATLGDNNTGSWVGTYTLNYTTDFNLWKGAKTGENKNFFSGNDVRLDDGITRDVHGDIKVRAVRFIPVFFYKKACMRVEICGNAVFPDKPSNLRITKITSRNATFSWTPPTDGGDGELTNYVIKITADANVIQSYTVVKASSSSTATNLTPNKDYILSIVAQNKHGLSNEAHLLFTTKEDDRYPDKPTHLKIDSKTSRTVSFSWTSPPIEDRGDGLLQHFIINLVELKTEGVVFLKTYTEPKTSKSSRVENLKPYTKYMLSITAQNKRSSSHVANITFTTEEEAPTGHPLDVKVVTLNSSSLHISWSEPEKSKQNGVIVNYTLTIQRNPSDFWIKTTTNKMLIANNLNPLTLYYVKVQASTKVGRGPYSVFIKQQTNNDILDGCKSATKWYIIVITLFCGLIIGIGVSLVAGKIRRHRTDQGVKSTDEYAEAYPQKDVNDSVYQELDLKEMKEEHDYQKLRKNIPIGNENKGANNDDKDYETPDV